MCHRLQNQSTLESDVKIKFSMTLAKAIKEVWILANGIESCLLSDLSIQMVGTFSFTSMFPGLLV